MIPDRDSQFVNDIIEMDVLFEQLRAWVRYEQDLTKRQIVAKMRVIRGCADRIERETRKAGFSYFGKVNE